MFLVNNLITYTVDGLSDLQSISDLKACSSVSIESLIVSGFKKHHAALVRAVERADLEVLKVYPAPLVTGSVLFGKTEKRVGCLFIDIDTETTSWSAFYNEAPYSVGCLPIGTYDIGLSVANNLGISIQEAIKTVEKKDAKNDEIARAKRRVLSRILVNIGKQLRRETGEVIPVSGGIAVSVPTGIYFECQKVFDSEMNAPITYIEKQGKKVPGKKQ